MTPRLESPAGHLRRSVEEELREENDRLREALATVRASLEETWETFGGLDHNPNDCPGDEECGECPVAERMDEALSMAKAALRVTP